MEVLLIGILVIIAKLKENGIVDVGILFKNGIDSIYLTDQSFKY